MVDMCIASVEKEHVLRVIAYTSSSSILLLANAVFVRALAAPSLLLSIQSLVSVLFNYSAVEPQKCCGLEEMNLRCYLLVLDHTLLSCLQT